MHLLHFLLLPFRLVLIPLVLTAALLFLIAKIAFVCGAFAFGARGRDRCTESSPSPRGSENSAFENYRRATLRRLEDEASEFRSFLERLRHTADAADFEAFLKARREGGSGAQG